MTKEQKIADIRAKCIEVNGDILKLEMGCKIDDSVVLGIKYETVFILNEYNEQWQIFVYDIEKNGYKIIGRKIGIADVLLAIANIDAKIKLNRGENILEIFASETMLTWNLLKDDLTLQSDETIDFIHDILNTTK